MQNTVEQYNFSPHTHTHTHTQVLILGYLTLNDMRVVLQEKVVQVFGDEGRHAGIRQGCEEYDISVKGIQKEKKEGRNTQQVWKVRIEILTFVIEIQVEERGTK